MSSPIRQRASVALLLAMLAVATTATGARAASTTCSPRLDRDPQQVAPHLQLVKSVLDPGTCPPIQVADGPGSGVVWGTDWKGGLWRSTDDLTTWTRTYQLPAGGGLISHVLPLRSGHVLIVVHGDDGSTQIFRSLDTHATSFALAPSLVFPAGSTIHGSDSWAEASNGIYVTEYGASPDPVHLWRSTDDGVSFFPVYEAPGLYSGSPDKVKHFHDVFADPDVPGRIWLTTGDQHASRIGYSDDGGTNFTFVTRLTYPQSRAVGLLFTADAVYWGTDSDETLNQVWRWDRATGTLTQELSGTAGPWYDGAQYNGMLAQFSTVPLRTWGSYTDEYAHVITSVGGADWTDTALPWHRDSAHLDRKAIQERITQPDGGGRFWVAYSTLRTHTDPVMNIEFRFGEPGPLETTLDSSPGATNAADYTFTFHSSYKGVFECRHAQSADEAWDESDAFACGGTDTAPIQADTPTSYTQAREADGTHYLQIRACRIAPTRTCDDTPAVATYTVDTQGPDVSVTGGPGEDARVNQGDFAYSGPEAGETYECSMDSATDFKPCGQDYSLASLAQGSHSFRVRGLDALGNRGPTVERDFTWDTVAPQAVFAPFASPTSDPTPTFSYSAADDGGGHYTFECRLDSPASQGATEPCLTTLLGGTSGSWTSPAALPDGDYTFEVRATDAAGNARPTFTGLPFTVDTTPPHIGFGDGAPADGSVLTALPARFPLLASEPGVRFSCTLDGGAASPCASPYETPGALPAGVHALTVTGTDPAGNVSTALRRTFWAAVPGPPPASMPLTGQNPPPPACTVPKVRGKRIARARKILKRAHCPLAKVAHKRSHRARRGVVLSQRPGAGKQLAALHRVHLVVSAGKARRHPRH